LTKDDRYLLLATDGLWDEISRKQSAKIAYQADATYTGEGTDVTRGNHLAKNLLEAALTKVCKTQGISRDWLSNVNPGPQRRQIIDDITLLVLDLKD
jgi:serine/threonine protein phosphatase PrpC